MRIFGGDFFLSPSPKQGKFVREGRVEEKRIGLFAEEKGHPSKNEIFGHLSLFS